MKLSETSLRWALKHLDTIGDSDLFPWAAELEVFGKNTEETVQFLLGKELDQLKYGAARRFTVPKDEVSFRRATQLDPIDTVVLTSLIHQFGAQIESRRIPIAEERVFSYRFNPGADGWLYDRTQDWNPFWKKCLAKARNAGEVAVLDITDFYNQIYHHAIENQLLESAIPNQPYKWIKGLLNHLTALVSRGIPVGPHSAHLLAEASLIPFDNSLLSQGIDFVRFVDDIIVFGKDRQECRRHLYRIADTLDKQQRLGLNKSKTRFMAPKEFDFYATAMIEDRPINGDEKTLLNVINKYTRGSPYVTILLSSLTESDLRLFSSHAVRGIIEEYIDSSEPDFVRLRWFLRRLAQVGHPAAVEICLDRVDDMTPALSDICHYLLAVSLANYLDVKALGEKILQVYHKSVVQENEYFKICMLSLFARNGDFNHFSELARSYDSASPDMRREIILAARFGPHTDWLRELKESSPNMDPWCRNAYFISGISLPSEERKFFTGNQVARSITEELLLKLLRP